MIENVLDYTVALQLVREVSLKLRFGKKWTNIRDGCVTIETTVACIEILAE